MTETRRLQSPPEAPIDRMTMAEETMSVFEGRMLLDGGAPEIEVAIELTEDRVVLNHITGELGNWERSAVTVEAAGGGWFTLVLADDQFTFAPRRPGPFAGAVQGLAPPEVVPKKRRGRQKDRTKTVESKPATPAPREPKKPKEHAPKPERRPKEPKGRAAEMPAPVDGDPFGLPPDPVQPSSARARSGGADAAVAPAPARAGDSTPVSAPSKPAGPHKQRREPKREAKPPKAEPKPPEPDKRPKEPKPPRAAAPPKVAKEPKAPPAVSREAKPPGEPRRRPAAIGRGLRHAALVVSDQLRQTGIVPFDRLPGLDGRRTRDPDHQHEFHEHRLPGGLTRNVCHGCGLVSIGGSDD